VGGFKIKIIKDVVLFFVYTYEVYVDIYVFLFMQYAIHDTMIQALGRSRHSKHTHTSNLINKTQYNKLFDNL